MLQLVDGEDPPETQSSGLLLDDGEAAVMPSRATDADEFGGERAYCTLPIAPDHIRGRISLSQGQWVEDERSADARASEAEASTYGIAHLERTPKTGRGEVVSDGRCPASGDDGRWTDCDSFASRNGSPANWITRS